LTLAAIQGTRITLKVSGNDEKIASNALVKLIKDKFQEKV
jgi:phosphotransferase system HPr-like phosphotransfer protein